MSLIGKPVNIEMARLVFNADDAISNGKLKEWVKQCQDHGDLWIYVTPRGKNGYVIENLMSKDMPKLHENFIPQFPDYRGSVDFRIMLNEFSAQRMPWPLDTDPPFNSRVKLF